MCSVCVMWVGVPQAELQRDLEDERERAGLLSREASDARANAKQARLEMQHATEHAAACATQARLRPPRLALYASGTPPRQLYQYTEQEAGERGGLCHSQRVQITSPCSRGL